LAFAQKKREYIIGNVYEGEITVELGRGRLLRKF
jgi:hypothetical protein